MNRYYFQDSFDQAVDLLRKMLAISPETRISASKALTHKYFESPIVPKKEVKLNLKHYRFLEEIFISLIL